jgi:AhpD family alkylhydroperoxidase
MEARLKSRADTDVTTAIQHLYKALHSGGVDPLVLELVHLRVSQINGCSACVHGGVANAQKAGETVDRLVQLATWRETALYTPAERAALAVAEAATRLADTPEAVTDEMWADLTEHHDEKAVAAIILMVALTNFFNRINTTVRQPAGATWG